MSSLIHHIPGSDKFYIKMGQDVIDTQGPKLDSVVYLL